MNIFITGGTTGIGAELAKQYAKLGHRVGICGRDLSKCEKELTEKTNIQLYQASVTNIQELHQAIASFVGEGTLDMMIANAGRSHGSKSKTPNFQTSRDIMDTNVIGVLNAFEKAVEYMMKQKNGHLVAIASVAGLVGLPGASAYSASKAAVLKLCESYALDFPKLGIDVSAIAPGFIDTPLTRKNDHPMPFLMPVEKAGKLIMRAIEKKKVYYIFPWQMKCVILIIEKIPRFLYRKIMNIKLINYSRG
ncbi:MAG: short-chain dehydrogenase [Bdellovibrio sp. CG12_big_fil_rev_8_21_14_0_65_39_13]|nr:MAG: short-chain dehydrogenase [Bdellovibrio sp. CG22_combo_CG10-13_8_21_14_all_39_27]PIQ59805.1 MAG: short-chain dehydrogenase [Bdellovibrio sp. CG12_big_fil_rev_8_21_14_0_65_39_13]PIR36167.1 MAG: short-chain dehydrogenase [Bdellovibrio sp. CG11_big_fil_rev_8_21_14_0_20_39_38]